MYSRHSQWMRFGLKRSIYEDLLGRYQSERDTERKGYEVSWCNSCINNYFCIFQDEIHGKDGEQRELQKVLSEIRREHDNLKREVK